MPPSPTRLAASALAIAGLIGVIGFGWEIARFGLTREDTERRLERQVRAFVTARARQVTRLAHLASDEGALVEAAIASRDRVPALFGRLQELSRPAAGTGPSATIYALAGPAGNYKVLAWSEGPAEDLRDERLAGPAALFVAPGTAGLRLIALQPIEYTSRRIGVASAEAVLSPAVQRNGATPGYIIETSVGTVRVLPQFAAGEDAGAVGRFAIATDAGDPLLEAHFTSEELQTRRRDFRRRVVVCTTAPLFVPVGLAIAAILERRRRTRHLTQWAMWSALAVLVVVGAAAALSRLMESIDAPRAVTLAIAALAAAAVTALLPVAAWWRRWSRLSASRHRLRFVAEHGAAGVGLAAAVLGVAYVLTHGLTPASLERWQLPLMPIDAAGLLDLGTLLLAQIAIGWSVAAMLAMLAARWHLNWRRASSVAAIVLWVLPLAAAIAAPWIPAPSRTLAISGASAALAVCVFALFSAPLRRYYRRASQAMRLVLLFAAIVLPSLAMYPMAAASADTAARRLIEDSYAPAVAQHPDQLVVEIARVEREIDRIEHLQDLVGGGLTAGGNPSQLAFQVWNQTSLARKRLTSEVELFNADRTVVSRFALNVREFESLVGAASPSWQGSGCEWEDWSEVNRFGAEERSMLHSERGICDEQGRLRGAVVVHVVPEYRDLPFVSSVSPYYDVLGGPPDLQREPSRVPDLQVVVYGWSLGPRFTSGKVAWAIPDDISARVYQSRAPFWTMLPAEDRSYHVYFMNDRGGIYALGYPQPTLFQHLTRLAEIAVVAVVLFVLLLIGGSIVAPLLRRPDAPLRAVFQEIRTSFYRKLFLFFVLAAVGPVLLFALAFGAYMAGKFHADVEGEAANVVTVARRVLEELAAAEQHPEQGHPPPPDDVMVWIRQVVGQDVNLFDGPHLIATSQRDLFDSGLLPARTPAAVYRAIALNRLPVLVGEDQLGSFRYLVAAAPVPTFGRDAMLVVPLATRQREIDAQVDELNRGVLVGAVVVILFAAGLGASVAGRVSDPVARLTRATRLIAAGRLDVRLVADTADELGRLVDDFNSMARTLVANREELARSNQLKAWAEMARQVAHEIKNPLTPIQLAAEHLQRVHEDQRRPLGAVFDQCLATILGQVRLLRRIASEFSNFAGQPAPRPARTEVRELLESVVGPYRLGVGDRIALEMALPADLPLVWIDRTLVARALTNIVENAVQAMATGGRLHIGGRAIGDDVELTFADTGVGMDEEAVRRAFEPYFSTKTAGSGLGLANAKRNLELCGGTIRIASTPGSGTVATVTLPGADRRADAGPATRSGQ